MSLFRLRPTEYESKIGPFTCPRCKAEAQFLRIRLAYGLSICEIPLFPIRTLSEYVRCNDCNADIKAEEIQLPVEELAFLEQPWKCLKCAATSAPTMNRCVACANPRPIKRLQPCPSIVLGEPASPALPHPHGVDSTGH